MYVYGITFECPLTFKSHAYAISKDSRDYIMYFLTKGQLLKKNLDTKMNKLNIELLRLAVTLPGSFYSSPLKFHNYELQIKEIIKNRLFN